ncbi:MAG: glycosyltransferase family 4 protein, partial [Chitinispirillaceae bacterium]|nr:glycosyltransferase family 4 protein [Chitinispirillaceae bacterium]
MRKLYFITHRLSNALTGGEMCSQLLLQGAAKAGLQVCCWEGDRYGFLKKNVPVMNVIYLVKAFSMDKNALVLLDMDFHVRYILAVLYARFVKKAKILGLLYHYNYWDKYSSASRTIHYVIERWVSRQCDYCITISTFAKDNFRALTGKEIPAFILTPFSRDSEAFPAETARFSPGGHRLLLVGSIERRKNIVNVIKAAALLKTPFTFDIVGFFTSREYVRVVTKTIGSLGLNGSVILHGKISKEALEKMYSAATVFILVSCMEGYGMVYAEAMRFGLPLVATTRGAVPELVEDGTNGFLCDPDDVVQIADAISRLGDRETWERISSNNLLKSKTLKSSS